MSYGDPELPRAILYRVLQGPRIGQGIFVPCFTGTPNWPGQFFTVFYGDPKLARAILYRVLQGPRIDPGNFVSCFTRSAAGLALSAERSWSHFRGGLQNLEKGSRSYLGLNVSLLTARFAPGASFVEASKTWKRAPGAIWV